MDGDTCPIPSIPGWHTVLIGVQAGELHTTRPAAIPVFPSIARQMGDPVTPEEFDKWTQIMARLLSPVDKTNSMTQPVGKDADGKLWTQPPGSTIDHRDLTHRDAADQHPIAAITGLTDALSAIPSPDEKTADMTQPVGKDADGKLWTQPPGSTIDHRDLTHRDAADQHPISAITGLTDALSAIPSPAEKTADMTQPVGKDADGKLWTQPPPEATIDHRDLTHRDAADQHPISAITGLTAALDVKQPLIEDLDTIREGAGAGSTAVQPVDISDMATQTWVEDQGYLQEHQSLAAYRTAAAQDVIDAQQMHKQSSAAAGNLAKFDSAGQTVDSSIPANTLLSGGDEDIFLKILSGVQKVPLAEEG